jgi:hypothetical protein
MFKLSLGDLWRGLVMAVFGAGSVAALGVVGAVVMQPGFDVFSLDFLALLKSLTNAMIVASYSSASSYLLKNLLTDDNRNFLGIETKS